MAFSNRAVGVAAFVAIVPLFLLWSKLPWQSALLWGWFSGTLYSLLLFYWIAGTIFQFVGSWAIPMLLIVCAIEGLAMAGVAVVASLVGKGRFRPASIFALPAAWLFFETARSSGSLGLPFGLLGDVAAHLSWLLPLGAFGGVYLLTAVIALTNSAVAGIVSGNRARRVGLVVVGGVALGMLVTNLVQASTSLSPPTLRVAIAQGDIQQRIKWTPAGFANAYETYADLTRRAAKAGARVVVWPETAIAAYPLQDPKLLVDLESLARTNRIAIISGALDRPEKGAYYNSVVDVTSQGSLGGVYHKRWLMPFAEFLPLDSVLRHVQILGKSASAFQRGPGPVLLPAGGFQWSALICYESAFTSYARAMVRAGADAIIMVADDAWFEGTNEPYLHADIAAIEAVSTGRWIVRSTQTGVSEFVDPRGVVVAQLGADQRGLILCTIGHGIETVYDRYGAGWLFALALIVLTSTLGVALYRSP